MSELKAGEEEDSAAVSPDCTQTFLGLLLRDIISLSPTLKAAIKFSDVVIK